MKPSSNQAKSTAERKSHLYLTISHDVCMLKISIFIYEGKKFVSSKGHLLHILAINQKQNMG